MLFISKAQRPVATAHLYWGVIQKRRFKGQDAHAHTHMHMHRIPAILQRL